MRRWNIENQFLESMHVSDYCCKTVSAIKGNGKRMLSGKTKEQHMNVSR